VLGETLDADCTANNVGVLPLRIPIAEVSPASHLWRLNARDQRPNPAAAGGPGGELQPAVAAGSP